MKLVSLYRFATNVSQKLMIFGVVSAHSNKIRIALPQKITRRILENLFPSLRSRRYSTAHPDFYLNS